jgi:thiol-disulfide isomerase/thioredoxin
MPQPGMLMPIPRIAPPVPGVMPAGAPVQPRPYQYHAAPPASIDRRAKVPSKGGLSGFAITMIVVMCLLVGGGIYYFLNKTNTTPPIESTINNPLLSIQDISIQSTTRTSATITWKTDKPATSKANYGKTEEYGLTTQLDTNLSTSHSVTLTGLDSNTTYYFEAISTDATGTKITKEGNLTTLATDDKTAPKISGVNVANITESSAIITWVTDEPATGQVKYTKDQKNTSTTPADTNLSTTHSIALTKLDSDTIYNFTILSKDAAGNEATSAANQTFNTLSSIPLGSDVGDRAPDFTVQNLDGEDVAIKMSDFRGKIVMINFWAIWCGPCKEEMPYIQAVSDNWSNEDLEIISIAINYNENLANVNEFIADEDYTFPVFFDSKGQAKSLYSTSIYPTTFIIDTKGIIRYMQPSSFSDQAELEDMLNSI